MENIHKNITKIEKQLQKLLTEQKNNINSNEKEGIDYLSCPVCTLHIKSSVKRHCNIYHPEFNYELYLRNNPEIARIPEKYKKSISSTGDKHWTKKKEAKERLSKRMKGANNPNHKSKTTLAKRKQTSPKCIEFYQHHYPDLSPNEQRQLLDEHIERTLKTRGKNIPLFKEYWIKRGYSEEDAIKMVSERQTTFSLEICIEKHGKEKGLEVWKARQAKWRSTIIEKYIEMGGNTISMISLDLFDQLNDAYPEKEFLYNKEEKWIASENREEKYRYDFTYPDKRKIIEFNGDYWHMNPNKYNANDINQVKDNSTAEEIWERDKSKVKLAEDNNYEVLTIWESDYRNDPDSTINICMEFLND